MRITCLHTAKSNIDVFEAAARELGLPAGTLQHEIRADLLAEAEHAGRLTAEIEDKTASALMDLSRNADAVILTCSTLGPAAARAASNAVPILRGDDALAKTAVALGGKVVVLCVVETTVGPTTELFEDAAAGTGAVIDVRLVPGARALFKSGDQQGYFARVADAAEAAYADGADIVVLAQASMSGAAVLVKGGPRPLTSPSTGLEAAVARLRV